jgi:hypothetical protein
VKQPLFARARADGFHSVRIKEIAKGHVAYFLAYWPGVSARTSGIDPTNISIVTPIHDVHPIVFLIPEYEDWFVCQFHLHHRFAD